MSDAPWIRAAKSILRSQGLDSQQVDAAISVINMNRNELQREVQGQSKADGYTEGYEAGYLAGHHDAVQEASHQLTTPITAVTEASPTVQPVTVTEPADGFGVLGE